METRRMRPLMRGLRSHARVAAATVAVIGAAGLGGCAGTMSGSPADGGLGSGGAKGSAGSTGRGGSSTGGSTGSGGLGSGGAATGGQGTGGASSGGLSGAAGQAGRAATGSGGRGGGPSGGGGAAGGRVGGSGGARGGTTGAGGRVGSGGVSASGGVSGACPTAAPFDSDDADIRDRCTKRIYVYGGDDYRIVWSVDEGQTWHQAQPANIDGDDFVNDMLVEKGVVNMVGLPGTFASLDGAQTFTMIPGLPKAPGFDSYGGHFLYGAGRSIVLVSAGTFISNDGVTWMAQVPFPPDTSRNGFNGHFHGHAYGNKTFVFTQDLGKIRTYDGTTWIETTIGDTSASIDQMAFGNGVFVMASDTSGSGTFTATSTDGRTWTKQFKDSTNANLNGATIVVFDGAKFILYGAATYTSTDGATWKMVAGRLPPKVAVYQDGVFFGMGGNKLLFSPDGLTWNGVHDIASNEKSDVNGPRVTVGRVLK